MRTTAQILRDYRGPALFSIGFRPFFLFASIWAAVALPFWILALSGTGAEASAALTRDWHVHEMLFGYTGAVIVGYMTVAGANWTGSYPVAGRSIVVLVALWIAGRVAMLAHPTLGVIAASIDSVFLILFSFALWREQCAASSWRGLAPCIVISLLAVANVGFHARTIVPDLGAASERLAIGLITFLIALMGGRLVPSFTRNWMAQRRIAFVSVPYGRFDKAVLDVAGIGIAAWVVLPFTPLSGAMLIVAGIGLFVRLLRWRGWLAVRDGMVFILHLGYFWCALGLAMLGASILLPADVPETAAIHALTVGAIGVMTLAIMTRTSRSHTGRERRSDTVTPIVYVSINAAALTRVIAPFATSVYLEVLVLSAACWSLAFGLFAVVYGPILVRPWQRRA